MARIEANPERSEGVDTAPHNNEIVRSSPARELDSGANFRPTQTCGGVHTYDLPVDWKEGSVNLRWIAAALLVVAVSSVGVGMGTAFSSASGPRTATPHVLGAWGNPTGVGGWIAWSNGHVTPFGRAPNYGSARAGSGNGFVALVPDQSEQGYWLVTSSGRAFGFGDVCPGSPLTPVGRAPRYAVVGGIPPVTQVPDGFTMVTLRGGSYTFTCDTAD